MPAPHLVISLVYSLADSLWLAAGLWLCYRLIDWLLPMRPNHAYRLAGFLVSTLFLGWLAIFILYLAGGRLISVVAFHQLRETALFVIPNTWMYVAAGLYLVGLSFHLIQFMQVDSRLRLLMRETIPMTGEWKRVTDKHIGNYSRHRTIRVFLSNRVSSPLTFGWIRPVILFPVAAINNLTINEFESILLHEIAHIRRNDFLLQRVLALMEMTLFFNLFARDLCRTIRRLREECCDDEVLAAGTLPLDYITALGWCARQGIAFGGTLGAVGTERELLNRILRMTGGTRVKKAPPTYLYGMAILGILLGVQFSNLFLPTPSTNVKPVSVSVRAKTPMAKRVQDNRLLIATTYHPKQNIEQRSARKKAISRIVAKKSDITTDIPVAAPELIQTVGWQQGNDLIALQQGWKQIRQLSREELNQLMKEAMQEFNMEDKITWARLIRNKLLAQEMSDYMADNSWLVQDDTIAGREISPEVTRVQSKLMFLIWMKWRDKHPTLMEQLIQKFPADSGKTVPTTEQ